MRHAAVTDGRASPDASALDSACADTLCAEPMADFHALDPSFLSAKLHPPALASSQIVRERVWNQAAGDPPAKLVVVRAPAGYGKTTAMLQRRGALEAAGVRTAWLTLDRADNDVSRFLACMAAAIAGLAPGAGDPRAAVVRAALVSPADVAFRVIERLARHATPFALFLDDFEAVHEPTVLQLVCEILDHLPAHGQLVIGTRDLPELGLVRLRARGQLLEIDASSLRFSIDETAGFLSGHCNVSLADGDLAQLHRKTEGWIAALSLASVALARSSDRAGFIALFSGSSQPIARYLAEDVLASQPAHVREFLLRTSILRQLDEPLCEALWPRGDSAAILSRLEDGHLFVTPVDGDVRAYRYHPLFAEFLRDRFMREAPQECLRLHRVASQWYEAHGRPVPAIDHALDGRDYDGAMRLLALHAETLLEQGRMRLLARWFDQLPEALLQTSELLQVVRLWAQFFTRGPQEAMAALERSPCVRSTDPTVLAYVRALRPSLWSTMDRAEEAHACGRDALAHFPTGNAFADRTLANERAYTLAVMGRTDDAHRLLDVARSSRGRGAFHAIYAESIEGLIALEEGRLRHAAALFGVAVDPARPDAGGSRRGGAWAGLLYASVLFELNELESAAQLLRAYLPLARESGLPDHMIVGYRGRSRLAWLRGDVDEAFRSLAELEGLGHERGLPRVVCSARLERARVHLMQGRADAARAELDRANDRGVWERVRHLHLRGSIVECYELADLRWHIVAGDANDVAPVLDRMIGEATIDRRHYRVMKLQVLKAVASDRAGDRPAALATLRALLQAAATEGYVRLIADEGEPAGVLVRRLEAAMRDDGSIDRDPPFGDYLRKLVAAFGDAPATPACDAPPAPVLPEALTAKEIRVLALVAEGLSNAALARKLFVSDSTVRTHLRSINGKLDAENRTQAVAIGRRLGLIGSASPGA